MKPYLQKWIPQHALSRLMGVLGNATYKPYKNWMIKKFISAYGVDMSQALEEDPTCYATFNEFFTRRLKPGMRDFAKPAAAVLSPADGFLSEFGNIENGQLLQAKKEYYSLERLLADQARAMDFHQGSFFTVYLSPKDYHRVHMPVAGQLQSTTYIPGSLFSVNDEAVAQVPNLFARNERLVCYFKTAYGPMAVIMVGAMIVASIHTVWAGRAAPAAHRQIHSQAYTEQAIFIERGAELGFFEMGSTAIVLFAQDVLQFADTVSVGNALEVGNLIGIAAAQ